MNFVRSIFVLVLVAAALAASAQTFVNPGFETGDFTGWTVSPASTGSSITVTSTTPHSGAYAAAFGGSARQFDNVVQSIATVPGVTYRLSYYIRNTVPTQPTSGAYFSTVFGTIEQSLVFIPQGSSYVPETVTARATSTSMTLDFAGYSAQGFYEVDDVSVTPVPEPSTLAVLGLGAMAVLRRRRKA